MTQKLGLFIGRMNPPHKGHIAVITKALSQNEQVVILLGSNGVVDISNPLTFEQRKKLLQKYFGEKNNLEISIIKDTRTDLEWVQNISQTIQKYGNIELNIYGGDFENDSAILAMKQYELLLGEKVNYIPVDRFLEAVKYNGEDFHVSATNLRNALRNGNREFVERFCNEELVEEIIDYFK